MKTFEEFRAEWTKDLKLYETNDLGKAYAEYYHKRKLVKMKEKEIDLSKITRVEIIDSKGRTYTNCHIKHLEFSYQDDDRTLKLFITDNKPHTK